MKKISKQREKLFRAIYKGRTIIRRRLGAKWLIDAENYIDRKLLIGSPYETEQIGYMLDLCDKFKPECFFDIGANFGLYSVILGQHNGNIEQIFAFEPQPENFNQLCGNIYINRLSGKIQARNFGISNSAGKLTFLKNRGSSTGRSRIKDTAPAGTKFDRYDEIEIQVDSIDTIFPNLSDQRILIKIDVEGHERPVLEGMEKLLANNNCWLQIEILGGDTEAERQIAEQYNLEVMHRVSNDVYFATRPSD